MISANIITIHWSGWQHQFQLTSIWRNLTCVELTSVWLDLTHVWLDLWVTWPLFDLTKAWHDLISSWYDPFVYSPDIHSLPFELVNLNTFPEQRLHWAVWRQRRTPRTWETTLNHTTWHHTRWILQDTLTFLTTLLTTYQIQRLKHLIGICINLSIIHCNW